MGNARELAADLLRLLRRQQGTMADFLVALADFDDRRIWLKLGAEAGGEGGRSRDLPPGSGAEAILEAGLDLVIEQAAKRIGICARPKPAKSAASPQAEPDSGDVPAAVKREVWIRDGGRCQLPLEGGGICGSTHRLQFDHVIPRAHGGKATDSNLRLLCQPCNLPAARLHFGDARMDRFAPRGRQRHAARDFAATLSAGGG